MTSLCQVISHGLWDMGRAYPDACIVRRNEGFVKLGEILQQVLPQG